MIKVRIIVLLGVFILSTLSNIFSREGMWPPFMINEKLFADMQKMGLNITLDELYYDSGGIFNTVVSFGGYCTGLVISNKGLVLTNHHCGYGKIQEHSCVDNDYLTDGFWAANYDKELPNPDLYVSFLVSVENVTHLIEDELADDITESERGDVIRQISEQLQEKATEDNHYQARVSSFFEGNEFYLMLYENYYDVRLVGTPPSSIGRFGGDTDNWEWPRHTGDFALFRIYTCPEGMPAQYSPDNIPMKSDNHLPISIEEINENDFTMTIGYSGSTKRYLTSIGIDFHLKNIFPSRINVRQKKMNILNDAMSKNDMVRIMYASKYARIANYAKNFEGTIEALNKLNVADKKRIIEENFAEWVNDSPDRQELYGEVMNDFSDAYEGLESTSNHYYHFIEAMWTGPDIISFANLFKDLLVMLENSDNNDDEILAEINKLREEAENHFSNYYKPLDQKLWAEMFRIFYENVPQDQHPDIFKHINKKHKNDFDKYAAKVYSKSIFVDKDKLDKFFDNPSIRSLKNDPALKAAVSVYNNLYEVSAQTIVYDQQLNRASRLFIKGLREMHPDSSFYPDANSTPRLSFGKVKGYNPADAIYYDYITTLSGVMEKEDPNNPEFIVPEKLKFIYSQKKFSHYANDKRMYVNFLSTNDITGGNSGSPVINSNGHLVGLAFDGNWEAMSSDIYFEPYLQRCINVDSRYILFVIDKYANADHLLQEMTIIK